MTYSPEAAGADCPNCPLAGSNVVAPAPVASGHKLRLVVVGEAPGRIEVQTGIPFKGPSGQLLWDELKKEGVRREDCHVTNACLCRPEEGDKQLEAAAICCRPRLLAEIAALPPEAPILTLGKPATYAVINSKRLMYARGFIWSTPAVEPKVVAAADRKATRLEAKGKGEDERRAATLLQLRAAIAGRVCIPTLHPAFVLRADPWLPVFSADVQRAARASNGPLDLRRTRPEILSSEESILARLYSLGPEVALDIETDGVDIMTCNLVCVGMSDGVSTFVIGPWRPEYAEALSAFLSTRSKVITHNGMSFDVPVLKRHGVQ